MMELEEVLGLAAIVVGLGYAISKRDKIVNGIVKLRGKLAKSDEAEIVTGKKLSKEEEKVLDDADETGVKPEKEPEMPVQEPDPVESSEPEPEPA